MEKTQSSCCRLAADGVAVPSELKLLRLVAIRRLDADVDETDGLVLRTASRSCNARHRYADVGVQRLSHTRRHADGRLSRDGAVLAQNFLRNAELRTLDVVRVRDDTADVRVTRPLGCCERGADEAARARFRRRERPAALAAQVNDRLRGQVEIVRTPSAVTITTDGCCGKSTARPFRRAERLLGAPSSTHKRFHRTKRCVCPCCTVPS